MQVGVHYSHVIFFLRNNKRSVLTLIPVEVDFIATGTFVVRGFDTMLWNDSNFENQYKMSPTGILKN